MLSGSELFFDPEEYDGLAPLIAGDEIEVAYRGEMLFEETYPSKVVLKGNLEEITKKSATLMGITFDGVTDGKIVADGYTFVDLPKYVIEKDDSITPLSEVKIGATLFIACNFDCEGEDALVTAWKPSAIYAYACDYPLRAKELLPWAAELSADEIVEIEEKSFNASVGPNGLITFRRTREEAQIQGLLSYFQNAVYREADGEEEIDGGGTVVYTVRTADEEYVYTTYAGYYVGESGCYRAERQCPYIVDGEVWYRFFTTEAECTLFVNGQKVKTYPRGLTEYAFRYSQEEPSDPEQKYVLECGALRLYLMDERRFLLDEGGREVLFELVGEKDFSDFFADRE